MQYWMKEQWKSVLHLGVSLHSRWGLVCGHIAELQSQGLTHLHVPTHYPVFHWYLDVNTMPKKKQKKTFNISWSCKYSISCRIRQIVKRKVEPNPYTNICVSYQKNWSWLLVLEICRYYIFAYMWGDQRCCFSLAWFWSVYVQLLARFISIWCLKVLDVRGLQMYTTTDIPNENLIAFSLEVLRHLFFPLITPGSAAGGAIFRMFLCTCICDIPWHISGCLTKWLLSL